MIVELGEAKTKEWLECILANNPKIYPKILIYELLHIELFWKNLIKNIVHWILINEI